MDHKGMAPYNEGSFTCKISIGILYTGLKLRPHLSTIISVSFRFVPFFAFISKSVNNQCYNPYIFGKIFSRRSEEHTSELQSHHDIVCRLLLEKKKKIKKKKTRKKNKKKKKKINTNKTLD